MTAVDPAWLWRLRDRLVTACPPRAPLIAVRYLGAEFSIVPHGAQLARELPCFVLPHAHGAAGPGGWTIHLVEADALAAGEPCAATARDGSLSLRVEASGTWTVTDEHARVRWHVAHRHTPPRRFVQDVYCSVRRLGLAGLPAAALLHASAVRLRGKTLVFLGHKGSGKSCHALHLIAAYRAELVASDKLCVWSTERGTPAAAGLIESVRIELAASSAPLDPRWFELMHTARAVAEDPACLVGRKACLSPMQFAAVMATRVVALTAPHVLIALDPAGPPRPPVRLAPSSALAVLHAHLIEDGNVDGARCLGSRGADSLAAVAEHCPVYSLAGRRDLTTLGDIVHRLVA